MIATLTANPCIDKTLEVEKFDLHKMNRARVLCTDFAGKGINVSIALNNLQVPTLCLGFNFPDGREPMENLLTKRGIEHHFLEVPGNLRVCTKVFDRSLKHTIEINEYGSEVSPEAGEQLLETVAHEARKCSFLTLSGSLPPGLTPDFYERCIRAVHRTAPDCRVVADAEKQLLVNALEAGVYFIKPNIHEFQDTFGCRADSPAELDRAVLGILARYPLEMICVSLGADGAYLGSRTSAWICRSVPVEVRSLQGAGDSLVAGMCLALERGLPPDEVLHFGVAAAGDSISHEGTRLCTPEGFRERLRQDIGMRRLR